MEYLEAMHWFTITQMAAKGNVEAKETLQVENQRRQENGQPTVEEELKELIKRGEKKKKEMVTIIYPNGEIGDLRLVVPKEEAKNSLTGDQDEMEMTLEEVRKQAGLQTYQELAKKYPAEKIVLEKERSQLAGLYANVEPIVEEGANPMSAAEWESLIRWLENREPDRMWDETL